MIVNIIDRRKRRFRWKRIHAIVESAWHDNDVADADQVDSLLGNVDYEERTEISVSEALLWAHTFTSPVTLYICDLEDTNEVSP